MKISIITVCFNSAATIADTMHSVAAQTHPDIEHLIVDGASKDETLAVIAANNPHGALVVSEKDGGIYDAMNKGIARATGEVIAFLNADDVYKDAQIIAQVAAILERENLDAVYGDVEYFHAAHKDCSVRRYNSGAFTPKRIAYGWMPAHPALFMRKALFDRYGVFKTDYRIAGDFELIARIFQHRDLRHCHVPQVWVRMQLGGISTSGWRATLRLNREILRALNANAIPSHWIKILLRYPMKALEYLPKAR